MGVIQEPFEGRRQQAIPPVDEECLRSSCSVCEGMDRNAPAFLHRQGDDERQHRDAHPSLDAADDAVQRAELHAADVSQAMGRQERLKPQSVGAASLEHQHAGLALARQHREHMVVVPEVRAGDEHQLLVQDGNGGQVVLADRPGDEGRLDATVQHRRNQRFGRS